MTSEHMIGTDLPEWSSPQDLAAWLDVSDRTIYAWRYQGTGPVGHRIGRHVRFRRADVESWLDQQADQPREAS